MIAAVYTSARAPQWGSGDSRPRYAAPQVKLFLKSDAPYKHARVHENLRLENKVEYVLTSALLHNSWRDYRQVQEKHIQYAHLLALDKYNNGKRSSLVYAVLRFFTDFSQQYILRLGFLDGARSFLMVATLGQYAYHKYAGLYAIELEDKVTSRPESAQTIDTAGN